MDETLRSSRGRLARLGMGAILTLGVTPASALAQGDSAPSLGWAHAVKQTQATGTATVLVVTSSRAKGSRELYRSLASSPEVAALKGRVIVEELSADAEPDQVDRMALASPSVVAFRRGATGGLERAGSVSGAITPAELVAWMGRRGLIADRGQAASSDSAVVQAGFGGHKQHPSPQQAPYVPPPVYYAPQPQPQPAPREVYVEREAPAPREVIVEREVEVVREAPAPRRVVMREVPAPTSREVVVEREVAAPRSLLTRTREVAPPATREVYVERAAPAPRQVLVREVPAPREREVIIEREVAAPVEREVIVEREAPAVRRVAAAPRGLSISELNLVRPGPIDRAIGALGNRLRKRGLPRVALEVEMEETYRLAPAPATRVIAAPAPAYASPPEPRYVQPPTYAPSPQYGPSPQQPGT